MRLFDFFAFSKRVLIEAKKNGWEHVPERDRMICDEVEFAFSKSEGDKVIAVMEVQFDLSAFSLGQNALEKTGVATFENHDICRVLRASDIPFGGVEKLFDPMVMLYYAKNASEIEKEKV